jgi:hypothetical protein
MDLKQQTVEQLLDLLQQVKDEIEERENEKNAELYIEWQMAAREQWKHNFDERGLDSELAEKLELVLHWSRPGIRIKDKDELVYFETKSEMYVGIIGSPDVVGVTLQDAHKVFADAGIDVPEEDILDVFSLSVWRPQKVYY